ncbi:hypothetical protein ADK51_33035 [Streptomyces sp. WM6368]|nr:hypothetical protein ADK51_33035 [Streptomyces sp. WM6368]
MRALPFHRAIRARKKLVAAFMATRPRLWRSSADRSFTPKGTKPPRTSATRAAVTTTISTLLRPCSLQ